MQDKTEIKISELLGINTEIPENEVLESLVYILSINFKGKYTELIYGKNKNTRKVLKKLIGEYYTRSNEVNNLQDIYRNMCVSDSIVTDNN
jgi:hypothetical protein